MRVRRFKKGDLVTGKEDWFEGSHAVVISKRYYKNRNNRDCILVSWLEPTMGLYFHNDSTLVKHLKLIARANK